MSPLVSDISSEGRYHNAASERGDIRYEETDSIALIALAGQGYLRGISNLRRPLVIVRGQAASEACSFLTVAFCALGAFGRFWVEAEEQIRKQTKNSGNNFMQDWARFRNMDFRTTVLLPAIQPQDPH